ncbi:MAG: hypothetical protein KA198_10560 [Chitinophagaceae bacterium]|nr:hypothetical protein [Chitinophagaceae bacterium]
MNSSDLKLNILRQVDTLEDDVLKEVFDFIQNKMNSQDKSVLDSLSLVQRNGVEKAQESIREGKGISHDKIVSKYTSKYGIG